MSDTKTTKDHVIIEKWAEERDGEPCRVKGTKDLIRIRFDPMEESLEKITWAEFIEIFDKKKLKFLYEDSEESRFYKFID